MSAGSFEVFLATRNASDYADFFLPHLTADARVLDVGCGTGTITVGLAERVGEVPRRPRDEFDDARRYASEHGLENIEFRRGSVYALELPSDYSTLVLAHSMLETLEQPLDALTEIKRTLKPSGIVGVACVEYGGVIIAGPGEELLRRFYSVREQLWQLENTADPYRGRRLRGLLHDAGFEDVVATSKFFSYGTPAAVRSSDLPRAEQCRDERLVLEARTGARARDRGRARGDATCVDGVVEGAGRVPRLRLVPGRGSEALNRSLIGTLTSSARGAKMRVRRHRWRIGTSCLRLEYDYASRLLGNLTEIRFKLLALVPTLSGAVVALVSSQRSGVELLAIGALGLAATSGVLAYELRNGELRRRATDRVNRLETELFPGGPLVGGRGFGSHAEALRPDPGVAHGSASGSSTARPSAGGSTSWSGGRLRPPERMRIRKGSASQLEWSPHSRSCARSSSPNGPSRSRPEAAGPPGDPAAYQRCHPKEEPMRRLSLCLAAAAGALVLAPAALADGPLLVTQGGAGVASHDGAFHYVAVPYGTSGTLVEKIDVAHAGVFWWMRLPGAWGTPDDRERSHKRSGALPRRPHARAGVQLRAVRFANQVPRH
jgi:SAM-dependent methyltransferase